MLTLEEIKDKLSDRRVAVVADAIGVSRKAVWAIMTGATVNPSYRMMKKLSDYLEGDNK